MTIMCKDCGGSGIVERNDKLYECHCAIINRRLASMQSFIRVAPVRKEHMDLPILGMTKSMIFVRSTWSDMKAILKLAILFQKKDKFFKLTSDRELRDVFVGASSRTARGDDTDGPIYNSLSDLMEPPDLVIVRLNELHYKNKAAPGLLEEALSYRIDREKPIWVMSDTDRPFTTGSFAYSQSVWELMVTALKEVNIPRINPRIMIDESGKEIKSVIDESSILAPEFIQPKVQQPKALSNPKERTIEKIQSAPDESLPMGLGIYGSGLNKTKFKRGQ